MDWEFIADAPRLELELPAREAPEMEFALLTPEEALSAGLTPAAYRGEPGKSPRIGADECWEVYDETGGGWISTGICARGATDYAQLSNRPRINGRELIGDKSSAQLGLETPISNAEIEALFAQ